jgi:hypothetical protein
LLRKRGGVATRLARSGRSSANTKGETPLKRPEYPRRRLYYQLWTQAPDEVSKAVVAQGQLVGTNQVMAYLVMMAARAAKMTPEERAESARKAAKARWDKKRREEEFS